MFVPLPTCLLLFFAFRAWNTEMLCSSFRMAARVATTCQSFKYGSLSYLLSEAAIFCGVCVQLFQTPPPPYPVLFRLFFFLLPFSYHQMDYYVRTSRCKAAKCKHIDFIDEVAYSREQVRCWCWCWCFFHFDDAVAVAVAVLDVVATTTAAAVECCCCCPVVVGGGGIVCGCRLDTRKRIWPTTQKKIITKYTPTQVRFVTVRKASQFCISTS